VGNEMKVIYRKSQEERPIIWEVTVSVILSKNYILSSVQFLMVFNIQLFYCTVPKLLIRKSKIYLQRSRYKGWFLWPTPYTYIY
jgi:hypothetical protein